MVSRTSRWYRNSSIPKDRHGGQTAFSTRLAHPRLPGLVTLKRFLLHYRFRLLLGSIVLVMAVLAFPSPPLPLELGSLVLMVLASLNSLRNRSPLFVVVSLAGIVSLGMLFIPGDWSLRPWLHQGIPQMCFYLLMVAALFRRVTRERPVTAELLYGLCSLYLNFVLVFAFAYNMIEQIWPHSFTGNGPLHLDSFIYLSMITLTTIGYGDIAPTLPLARLLAGSEAIMGALFIALAVARGLSLMNDDIKD